MSINFIGMIGAVMLTSFVFAAFGVLFTYRSTDFTTLLIYLFAFFMLLAVPTVLQFFGVITADWFRYIQFLNPTQSALTVMNAAVREVEAVDFAISLSYLIAAAGVLYYFVSDRFDRFSMKEYGG